MEKKTFEEFQDAIRQNFLDLKLQKTVIVKFA
jgi:hypothetical protein